MASQAQATPAPGPDQRVVEHAFNQIARLNEWLEQHRHDLYWEGDLDTAQAVLAALASLQAEREALRQQMVQMDADNADLTQRLREATAEVDLLTRQESIAVGTLNELLEHRNGDGNGAAPQAADWTAGLAAELADWLESFALQRRRFGSAPRRVRLALVQAFARSLADGAVPTQPAFDAARPGWMPGAGGIAAVFDTPWSAILDLDPALV